MNPRPVYIVDGARTPFLKIRGAPRPFTPVDLAVQCGRPLLLRQPFAPEDIDQVILGCGAQTTAFTVQINCGSGMQAMDTAYRYIAEGGSDLILAGGTEALSHAPLVLLGMLRAAAGFRPEFLKLIVGLERGLTDPITDLGMGQTAEVLAHLFGITREAADAYAVESHKRLARAQEQGWLEGELVPAFARDSTVHDHDNGVRPDSAADKLAKRRPVFEPPYGKVTAGNSSQITDGACWTLLASETAIEKYGLTSRARIVDSQWSALDPSIMGLGLVLAATELLKRGGLALGDIDLWELNEAFAAQVLACLAAWEDDGFCRNVLGLDGAAGTIPRDRINVDGGAISLGHPVGASGARITLHLVQAMERLDLSKGIATECIGGGQGGAMLIERAGKGAGA